MVKLYILSVILLNIMLSNDNYAEFEVLINNNPYPSNMFIHTQHSNYMAILDESLSPYWFIKSDHIGGLDFKPSYDIVSYFDKSNSQWILANKNMIEVDTVKCTLGVTDYHDIRILESGGYILQAYDSLFYDMSNIVEGGHHNAKIKGILRIQEFNSHHELIFDWFALDHLEIQYYNNVNLANAEFTWMHGNSIEIDHDDNLIISDRRSSQIIKIDRLTGNVMWIFGGPLNSFQIVNDPLNGFSKQHDARRLYNGNLLLFDNGNNHNPPQSRVVEYIMDEINMEAYLHWSYSNPYNDISVSMGSVQRLPNQNTLINWGNIHSRGAHVMEVDPYDNIVLEIEFDIGSSYKVRKSNWNYNIPMLIGDANLDDIVNIIDVLYIINHILYEQSLNIFKLYKVDLDKNATVNVSDILILVNQILQ